MLKVQENECQSSQKRWLFYNINFDVVSWSVKPFMSASRSFVYRRYIRRCPPAPHG